LHAPRGDLLALLGAVLLLLPLTPAAQGGWILTPGEQQRLAAGEVVVTTAAAIDPGRPRGRVLAAVLVNASPEAIWGVMTDCKQAPLFVPGLKRCSRIAGAADGSWEDFEQVVQYSWFLPTVRYVLRATYDRPRQIQFRRISGDLKDEEGSWLLTPTADGSATLVQYEVYVDPGFWVPQVLVTRTLRKDLPTALAGLRARAQSGAQ
jgi:ribosome-associated toxin RatA of RatAB toxin-antitoxin module